MTAAELVQQLDSLEKAFAEEVQPLRTEAEIRAAQARFLGKKGKVSDLMKALGKLAAPERPLVGEAANRVKQEIEDEVGRRLSALAGAARAADLARVVDVTLPGRGRPLGHLHPLTQARREIERIFAELGYQVETGPQIEDDFHNFEALGMPAHHPARDMQDTFYINRTGERGRTSDLLLRTHTSPVQIRTMRAQKPPVKIIAPGIVYRRDDDPTHSPQFMQVEGLLVDEVGKVTLADLKGTLLHFVRRFFGPDLGVRLRPSFFPFTEPSAEIDIGCVFCRGKGCRLCKGTGWLEVGGSGMVDPEVFKAVGYDPDQVAGFAFGVGIDRMAMLRWGIDDIKLMYENDVRFLRQL